MQFLSEAKVVFPPVAGNVKVYHILLNLIILAKRILQMLLIQLIFLYGVGMRYHGSPFKKGKTETTGWFMPGTGSGKQIRTDILRCQGQE